MKTPSRMIPVSTLCRARMLAPAAVLLAATAVWGQNVSETLADFGTLGQLNTGVTVANADNVAPVACAPTSAANGLEFLDNTYGPALFTSPAQLSTYTAVNNLATAMGTSYNATTQKGGTSFNGMVNGVTAYLSPTGANPAHVYVQSALWGNTTPAQDANTLAGLLRADDAVELLIQWGGFNGPNGAFKATGGHAVTLDAMNINQNTGVGTLSFVDPWGGGPAAAGPLASASYVTANVNPLNGFIYMTNYSENIIAVPPVGEAGIPGDFGANQAVSGIVVGYVAEGVPDVESTWAMLGACAAGLTVLRRAFRRELL